MRQQDVAEWKASPALANKFITNINIIKSETNYHFLIIAKFEASFAARRYISSGIPPPLTKNQANCISIHVINERRRSSDDDGIIG